MDQQIKPRTPHMSPHKSSAGGHKMLGEYPLHPQISCVEKHTVGWASMQKRTYQTCFRCRDSVVSSMGPGRAVSVAFSGRWSRVNRLRDFWNKLIMLRSYPEV
ncbi:hypothetical protein BDV26DRAFT_255699 [Aspergillus bertholletiae]|uniref:Uncharacterized protein n=1 Tax=Aspergillus bertholletiae TaxID=1226010 RepID=A0A5N7BHM9_9EURO|nr:hypothetical protein BDV26DRAFT_255699 [Aspergillus bertholletiae]